LIAKAQPSLIASSQNDHGRRVPGIPKQQEVDGSCSQRNELSGTQILLSLQREVAFLSVRFLVHIGYNVLLNDPWLPMKSKATSVLNDEAVVNARFQHLKHLRVCKSEQMCSKMSRSELTPRARKMTQIGILTLIYGIVAFMMFTSCIDTGSALKRVGTSQYLQNVPNSYGTFSLGID
jgi:hypothetical protein